MNVFDTAIHSFAFSPFFSSLSLSRWLSIIPEETKILFALSVRLFLLLLAWLLYVVLTVIMTQFDLPATHFVRLLFVDNTKKKASTHRANFSPRVYNVTGRRCRLISVFFFFSLNPNQSHHHFLLLSLSLAFAWFFSLSLSMDYLGY